MNTRIDYFDGLRGVAILLVLGFHAYSKWPEMVPYGDTYQYFPIFNFGWVGVQLFFLVSGFVIFMTLDKTKTFHLFMYKRWLRLFPGMLLACLLIYTTSFILDSRPAGSPSVLSVIQGLTFIEPYWWGKITGLNIVGLEGAFWSLYVEFKFYVVAGFIYFILGRKLLPPCLLLMFAGSVVFSYAVQVVDVKAINIAHKICETFSFKYFGWFASGSFYYLFYQNKRVKYFFVALLISILSSMFIGSIYAVFAALMISLLFSASLRVGFVQRILSNRCLVFFGFISYPLYLMHENAMVSMIVQFSAYQSWLNMLFHPLLPITILSVVAYLIASRYERLVRDIIKMAVENIKIAATYKHEIPLVEKIKIKKND